MEKLKPNECGKIGGIKSGLIASEKRKARIEEYGKNPKLCKKCKNPIEYDKQRNQFCSHSCAASYNNQGITRNGENQDKPCKECGAITSNSKYCSRKCFRDSENQKIEEIIEKGEYVTVNGWSNTLKKYVIKKRGHRCEHCDNSKWLGEAIPLNLHHKNGDAMDNNLSNLELVCLNCHGLTPNYGAKNKNSTRDYRYKKK